MLYENLDAYKPKPLEPPDKYQQVLYEYEENINSYGKITDDKYQQMLYEYTNSPVYVFSMVFR